MKFVVKPNSPRGKSEKVDVPFPQNQRNPSTIVSSLIDESIRAKITVLPSRDALTPRPVQPTLGNTVETRFVAISKYRSQVSPGRSVKKAQASAAARSMK